MKEKSNILPTLLGLDLNAYSVAMAFHSAYGVRSYAFGRYTCGISEFSKIIKIEFCSGYQGVDSILPELISFAKKNRGKRLILVPCSDIYVEFVNKYSIELSEYYEYLVPTGKLVDRLTNKAELYRELRERKIDFPEFFSCSMGENYVKKLLKLEYPLVLKPAVSTEYWGHPFPKMKKVYYPKNRDEAANIISEMRYYGYMGEIILQKLVTNHEAYVYTALYNKNGDCDFGVFGRVMLGEIGKTSRGNYSVIVTEERGAICDELDKFLKDVGYFGFANFDILKSGDKYYVLELNARQGRSCDHILKAGINIAERLIFCLDNNEITEKREYQKILWHYPTFKTALKFMDEKSRRDAAALKAEGCAFNALNYREDLLANPLRTLYVFVHGIRLKRSFKKDYSDITESV